MCGVRGIDDMASVANTGAVIRSVVVVGFQGVQALDLVGPFDVFIGATVFLASQGRGDDGYEVSMASVDAGPVSTGAGLELVANRCPIRASRSTPSCCPVVSAGTARQDARLIEWIKAVAPNARRVISVCNGAHLAAEAGLLDGCIATTHWAYAGQLAREFPSVAVDPDRSSCAAREGVDGGRVTSGIDLALSLVEDDYGTEVAQTVARWLVLYLRRPGGQTQFAAPVWMPRARREPIREAQEAIESEPGGAHRVPELARRAAMSPRHFTRVFTDEVGEAPGAYVERVRTEAARRQLEETDDTVTVIAARCGFGTAETMRRNFVRRVGISPDHYRKTFA